MVRKGKVLARNTVFGVAEREHQFVTCLCILRKLEAFLLRARREAEVGKRGRDDVESRDVGPTLSKLREDFGYFEEAARPCKI